MKLIKKIAAIMFAFMMVFSLSTNVKADNGVNTSQGSITIDKVRNGETYKIYRILDLDSYYYPTGNPKGGNYSYTYKEGDKNATEWKNFIDANTGDGKYFKKTGSKYFTANDGVNGEDIAKAALQYVKENGIEADDSYTATENGTYTFNNLPLGYYLVESSVSALCSLDTTNPNQTIEVKYEEPTVTKQIIENLEGPVSNTTANIGDKITYYVTIPVKKGATKYVFYDQLGTGLKYYKNPQNGNKFSVAVDSTQEHTNGTQGVDYTLTLDANEQAFTIKFEDSFLQKISVGKDITLTYIAIVTNEAPMNAAINNTAYLKYGNNQQTTESTTSVYTYNIPVFKYTGDKKTPLADATFKLYRSKMTEDNLLKFDEKNEDAYKYSERGGVTELVSDAKGNININGLSAGTYFLEETKAPNGYNKLEKAIKVVVSKGENGKPVIHVDEDTDSVEKVEVKNNTGGLLPSTGGMGTTLIYLVGGALVLGSGFVLANKKRAKAK